jgi:carbamoyl-phosphate synthase large subunit
MEYLPGTEYTVDILSDKKRTRVVVPRRRDVIRTGITFEGTVEKDIEIIDYSTKLTEIMGLEYAYGFQFKRDEDGIAKILECNPRIQGTMVLSTLAGANIIYGAVKLALGEGSPEYDVKWGTRLLRYWGGVGVLNEKLVDEV